MFLIVETGEVRCGLPLKDVVEVMRPQPLRQLAQAPPGVSGVAVIRGEAQPVLDLGVILQREQNTVRRFVSLRAGERLCALAVSAVIGIQAIDPATWRELPPLLKNVEWAEAISVLDRDLVLLLEGARLLPLLPPPA
jgi:purine-binding chemotaxis protein CheW